jgi:cell wall-associated NlpC family hydrolase
MRTRNLALGATAAFSLALAPLAFAAPSAAAATPAPAATSSPAPTAPAVSPEAKKAAIAADGNGTYTTFTVVNVPAPTVTKTDPNLPVGTKKTTPGKPGQTQQFETVVVSYGKTVERKPGTSKVLVAPVPTVIVTGTKAAPAPAAAAAATTRTDDTRANRSTDRGHITTGTSKPKPATPKPTSTPKPTHSGSSARPTTTRTGNIIADAALAQVGSRYIAGGTGNGGFDCSGLVQYAYRQAGISLPRTSGAQGASGHPVSRSEARPGDIVYRPGHVGIYIGNGQKVHASTPSTGVRISSLSPQDQIIRVG